MTTEPVEDRLRSALDEVLSGLPLNHRDRPRSEDAGSPSSIMSLVDSHSPPERATYRRTRLGKRALAGGVGIAAAVGVLLLTLSPSLGQSQPLAAGAQLHQIAANAAQQPAPRLRQGQVVLARATLSVSVQLDRITNTLTPEPDGTTSVNSRSTPIPDAKATFDGTMSEWSNDRGGSCILFNYGSPRFASGTEKSAWQAQDRPGVAYTFPHGPEIPYCATDNGPPTLGDTPGAIDVSRLPLNSKTLAHELAAGTTGIAAVDTMPPGPEGHSGFDAGFERAADLLTTPTTGGSPALTSALYGALALVPGVRALGEATTESGVTGLEFSGSTNSGRAELIVNPDTGGLLELRGTGSGTFLTNSLPDVGLSLAFKVHGAGYSFKVQWVDRDSAPKVVGANSLPQGAIVPGS